MIPKLIAKFTNSLALGVETSSTEMLLSSTVSRDNQTIPSGTYGFVINRGQENEEFCIGSYVAGTVTFTARGLSYLDGITEISANKKKHRKGDPVEMTTHPALTYIAKMLAGDIDLDGILKYPATRLINNQRQLVDKEYADGIVSSQITSLKVSADGALTVAVNSGYYSLNGVITYYAGSAGNALTDAAVNYVQLNDGALAINTSGFTEGAMPLAKITTASGAITINEDARAILGWLDVKTNSGIGRDSTGLFIDLATAPGLEFSSGKLKAKLKTSGGILLDADGLHLDVGVTVGKIIQVGADDKLPAVDASELLNLHKSSDAFTATPSANTKTSSDSEVSSAADGVTRKVKEIVYNDLPGVVKVSFNLKTSANGYTVNGRIYKNGSPYGTDRSSSTTNETTFTEDLSFATGDLIQLYITSSSRTAYASLFRIAYDKVVKAVTNTVNL